MDPFTQSFFGGLEDEIVKTSGAVAAAPAAKSIAQKALAVIQKRPVGTAVVAAAGGAGAATGVAEAKKKKEQEEKRRERIRQLLMRRLSRGY
jgi:hypothetical protein